MDAGPGQQGRSVRSRGKAPEVIGRYRLARSFGHGPFGIVYEAEQVEPVARRVAVKVLKALVDRSRVEAELSAQSALDHPHLCRMLDGGQTPDGQLYSVSDLVKGEPITAYCDAKRLGIKERVALFLDVCEAVQAAHQKGVIHGALKPTNILIATRGTEPAPMITDIGTARVSKRRLADAAQTDDLNAMASLLAYCAPERLQEPLSSPDTRFDVYALGALLYELLVGTPPRCETLRRAQSMADVEQALDEPVLTPSQHFSRLITESDSSVTGIARARSIDAVALTRRVRGDLDWITMKALARQPGQRYRAVAGLADDLRRYLRHEPVSPAPQRTTYRLRKLVRRRTRWVASAALVTSLLTLALLVSLASISSLSRSREQMLADHARTEAAWRSAERARREAAAVATFVGEMLSTPGDAPDARIRDVLDNAVAQVEGGLADPLVEARLRELCFTTYRALGDDHTAARLLAPAVDLRRQVQGVDHEDTMRGLEQLASVYAATGELDEAAEALSEVVEHRLRVRGSNDRSTLETRIQLAALHLRRDDRRAVEPLLRDALETAGPLLDEEDPDFLAINAELARLALEMDRLDDAEPLLIRALQVHRKKLGPAHELTLEAMDEVARLRVRQGRLEEAEDLYSRMIIRAGAEHGEADLVTLRFMNNFARFYRDTGRPEKSASVYAQAVGRLRRSGQPPVYLGISLAGYGRCLTMLNRYEDAEAALLEARDIVLSANRPDRLPAVAEALAELYDAWERPNDAQRWRTEYAIGQP